jgi:hypothetical protein
MRGWFRFLAAVPFDDRFRSSHSPARYGHRVDSASLGYPPYNIECDDALVVAQLPDRRVVRRLGADEEAREKRRGFPGQELLQDGRGQLAAAATAMGEFRQAKGRPSWGKVVHRDPSQRLWC